MVDQALLEQMKRLGVEDRLEIIGALWDTIDPDTLPVEPEVATLIDERLADADADPLAGESWEDVRESLRLRRAR
jgi:putative addiction module component (TIGR02574 family)